MARPYLIIAYTAVRAGCLLIRDAGLADVESSLADFGVT